MISRRRAILWATVAGMGAVLARARALAEGIRPRQRLIIDNDFSGDPDGLFQLAHHLCSPSVSIALVIGSHLHPGEPFDPSPNQADKAVDKARALLATMRDVDRPPMLAGRQTASDASAAPDAPGLAARAIVSEAMRADNVLPLYYVAGAGLTDLAEALRLEPRIAQRMTLVWIGGMEHLDLLHDAPTQEGSEYNSTIDIEAARTVFNDSGLPIWQVPRNAYRQMLVSYSELVDALGEAGALGRFLLAAIERVMELMNSLSPPGRALGETYILGDSPLVTLTALQSSFEPDSASSGYVVRPTPKLDKEGHYVADPAGRPMRIYTSIDTRLTFEDMFRKFRKHGKR